MTQTPATEKQVAYLQSLRTKRIATPSVLADVEAAEAGLLSKADASSLIELMLNLPFNGTAFRRTSAPAAAPQPAAQRPEIPAGFYTITDGEGHVTLKVTHGAEWCDGKTVVSYLFGTDNVTKYRGFAFITPSGEIKVWAKFANNNRLIAAAQFLATGKVDEARETFLNVAEAYALRSGHCFACGHHLTVPASLHRGLGPVCAQRLGVA